MVENLPKPILNADLTILSFKPIPFNTDEGSNSLLEQAEPEDITVFVNLDIKTSESTFLIEIFKFAGSLFYNFHLKQHLEMML